MTIALDADVLVNWAVAGSPFHAATRRSVERWIREGTRLALTTAVLCEFLHVATDPRRFPVPLAMSDATRFGKEIWEAAEVERLVPVPAVLSRTLELLGTHRLGRNRVHDTFLAAILELAGIRRLATFNRKDYEIFPFLEVVSPAR